jgi:hypothetical protein
LKIRSTDSTPRASPNFRKPQSRRPAGWRATLFGRRSAPSESPPGSKMAVGLSKFISWRGIRRGRRMELQRRGSMCRTDPPRSCAKLGSRALSAARTESGTGCASVAPTSANTARAQLKEARAHRVSGRAKTSKLLPEFGRRICPASSGAISVDQLLLQLRPPWRCTAFPWQGRPR